MCARTRSGRRVPEGLASEKRVQDPSVLYVNFTSEEDPEIKICSIRSRTSKRHAQTSYRA